MARTCGACGDSVETGIDRAPTASAGSLDGAEARFICGRCAVRGTNPPPPPQGARQPLRLGNMDLDFDDQIPPEPALVRASSRPPTAASGASIDVVFSASGPGAGPPTRDAPLRLRVPAFPPPPLEARAPADPAASIDSSSPPTRSTQPGRGTVKQPTEGGPTIDAEIDAEVESRFATNTQSQSRPSASHSDRRRRKRDRKKGAKASAPAAAAELPTAVEPEPAADRASAPVRTADNDDVNAKPEGDAPEAVAVAAGTDEPAADAQEAPPATESLVDALRSIGEELEPMGPSRSVMPGRPSKSGAPDALAGDGLGDLADDPPSFSPRQPLASLVDRMTDDERDERDERNTDEPERGGVDHSDPESTIRQETRPFQLATGTRNPPPLPRRGPLASNPGSDRTPLARMFPAQPGYAGGSAYADLRELTGQSTKSDPPPRNSGEEVLRLSGGLFPNQAPVTSRVPRTPDDLGPSRKPGKRRTSSRAPKGSNTPEAAARVSTVFADLSPGAKKGMAAFGLAGLAVLAGLGLRKLNDGEGHATSAPKLDASATAGAAGPGATTAKATGPAASPTGAATTATVATAAPMAHLDDRIVDAVLTSAISARACRGEGFQAHIRLTFMPDGSAVRPVVELGIPESVMPAARAAGKIAKNRALRDCISLAVTSARVPPFEGAPRPIDRTVDVPKPKPASSTHRTKK